MRLGFDLKGPEGVPFQVPDEDLLGPYHPRTGQTRPLGPMVERALDAPLEAEPLETAAARAGRVLLLIDDATRATPVAELLPPLVERLERAGVPDDRISVLVAQGTHRPMTRGELEAKLGPYLDRWTLHQHDPQDHRQIVRLGLTDDGMPVEVNRLLPEHDLVLGLGSVAVHGIMGYSGGAKIAMIGAAGLPTESWTHWQAATRYETHELMGVEGNPLRRNLEEGARLAGLDAVLNVVCDHEGGLLRVAYGEPVATHRALVPHVRDQAAVHLPRRPEVVVVDARPADRDFWQSVKGLYAAQLAVREGGTIILVAANREGVARNHPNVRELAGEPFAEVVDRVERGAVSDVIGGAIAAYTARLRRHAHLYLVSSGIGENEAASMGFTPAATVQDALDDCRSGLGRRPKVAVFERGGHLLPVVPPASSQPSVAALAARSGVP